jgi:fumarate reductase subunit D
MAIAKKALIWSLFAAGGTLTAFLFPALIALFLMLAAGYVPEGLSYDNFSKFVSWWPGKIAIFAVLFLSLWHAAHRLRVVFHDFGIHADGPIAFCLYTLAAAGSVMAAVLVILI